MSFMAGRSYWKGETSLNTQAINIMLLNDANSEFPDEQIDKLISTILDIQSRHGMEFEVLGLGEVALDKHTAPGKFFPWPKLAKAGIGTYVDTTDISRECLFFKNEEAAGIKQFQQKLHDYGYNIVVSGVYDDVTVKVLGVFGTRYGVPTDCWSEANNYVIETFIDGDANLYSQHIAYQSEETPITPE